MKKITIFICLLFFSVSGWSLENSTIAMEQVSVNIHDQQSILRGAKFFAGTCMSCHTMKYLKQDEVAKEAGITLDKMPLHQKEWLYGVVPPDLSLIARVHDPDWLYTYFHAFYKDPQSQTGYNNLLVPNSMMTNIFASMQGIQERLKTETGTAVLTSPHYYQVLQLVSKGSMSPENFDDATHDLVNFLVYASDPHAAERKSLGVWVLLFLAVFFVVTILLKKVYWKRIK